MPSLNLMSILCHKAFSNLHSVFEYGFAPPLFVKELGSKMINERSARYILEQVPSGQNISARLTVHINAKF